MTIGQKIMGYLNWPVVIVTAMIAIGSIIGYFGFSVESPIQKFEVHVVEERQYHDSASAVTHELDEHVEETQMLINSLVRGECLENKKENLVRQGLIVKCRELGVER